MEKYKKKQYPIWTDEDTHTEIMVMAARRKVAAGKVLKELVEKEKASQTLAPNPWTEKLKQKVLKEIPVSEHSDND